MSDQRPSPEQMLARIKSAGDEAVAKKRRGKLKIFFGYAAGVGKTFAMLQEARDLKKAGIDVLVGYTETHGRAETEALLEGLELLPRIAVPYRGATLSEFDLDAAVARKPAVILVDELAHTNAPGMRHAKRWQDIDELLAAGIDVHTTVNVQHVESLNDVIAEITGVSVRETVPDEMIDRAYDIALIDLPPDGLIERLREGKVYIPAQAAHALQKFFRKENLVALRELSLREVADRVHADVETARKAAAATVPWLTSEQLLVCVGPSPTSAKVVRAAKRLADLMRAPWIAVYIATPISENMHDAHKRQLHENLQLAERLGAETVQLSGDDVAVAVIEYAQSRNVTKIVVGKTDRPHRFFARRESIDDRLLRDSGNIDVYVVRGAAESVSTDSAKRPSRRTGRVAWFGAACVLAGTTAVALIFDHFGVSEANLVMVYLLGVVAVASWFGAKPAVATAFSAVLLFDVLFTRPYYRVTVEDAQYLVTFSVMLVVGLLISTLADRLRRRTTAAKRNERRTEALYRLSRRLTAMSGIHRIRDCVEHAVSEVFDCHAVVFLPNKDGKILPLADHLASFAAEPAEFTAAQWVYDHGRPAGLDTDTLPNMLALYVPLSTSDRVVGVLAVHPRSSETLQSLDVRQLLDTYAGQIALALERDIFAEQSHANRLEIETEKQRNALLSSVSHDLRTPLAAIASASGSMLQSPNGVAPIVQRELAQTIYNESNRLTRLVENILNMTRLTSGEVKVRKEWHPLDDVIGSALHRMRTQIGDRPVITSMADDLPLGQYDSVLIEQVLINLLENAIRYSDADSPIEIGAYAGAGSVTLEVADRGRGIRPEDANLVFQQFYRDPHAKSDGGVGLGLAICKAIAEAHDGNITVLQRPGGGSVFRIHLPLDAEPPAVPDENE